MLSSTFFFLRDRVPFLLFRLERNPVTSELQVTQVPLLTVGARERTRKGGATQAEGGAAELVPLLGNES